LGMSHMPRSPSPCPDEQVMQLMPNIYESSSQWILRIITRAERLNAKWSLMRREQPRRCSAKQRDEFPSPHGSPPGPTMVAYHTAASDGVLYGTTMSVPDVRFGSKADIVGFQRDLNVR
jgi:hypothetical protein